MVSRFLFFRGRRRGGRRDGERENVYVDRHGAWTYLAFAALVALSVVDAVYTLHELSLGATEANPVMRAALRLGNVPFVLIKTGATIVAGLFLILHKTWRLGRRCLALALAVYVALTAWHLYGLLHVLPTARAVPGESGRTEPQAPGGVAAPSK